MVTLRATHEFTSALDLPEPFEMDCSGSTVHACIDEVCRRADERIGEALLAHEAGERWKLKEGADVRVNGDDVRGLDGLGTPVGPDDVIELRRA